MTVAGRLEGADPEGKLAPIGMGRIEIGADALSLHLDAVSELARETRAAARRARYEREHDVRRGGEVLKAPRGSSAVTYSTWTAPSTSATICCRKRRRRSASSKRGRTSST